MSIETDEFNSQPSEVGSVDTINTQINEALATLDEATKYSITLKSHAIIAASLALSLEGITATAISEVIKSKNASTATVYDFLAGCIKSGLAERESSDHNRRQQLYRPTPLLTCVIADQPVWKRMFDIINGDEPDTPFIDYDPKLTEKLRNPKNGEEMPCVTSAVLRQYVNERPLWSFEVAENMLNSIICAAESISPGEYTITDESRDGSVVGVKLNRLLDIFDIIEDSRRHSARHTYAKPLLSETEYACFLDYFEGLTLPADYKIV